MPKSEIVGIMAMSAGDLDTLYAALRERISRLSALRDHEAEHAKRTGKDNARFAQLIQSKIDDATTILHRIVRLSREN
jgi:hypothetical protein